MVTRVLITQFYRYIAKMKLHLIHFILLTFLFSVLLAIQPISYHNWGKRMQRIGAGPIYDAHIFRCTDTEGPGNSWWWKIWCLAQTFVQQSRL